MGEWAAPQELIAGTDWARLEVFFGPGEGAGVRPVEELLTVLALGAPAQQARAVHELGEVINHQCSVIEATAPAILVVAALLRQPATAGVVLPAELYRDPPPLPLRAELLELIGSVVVDVGQAADESARRFGFPPSPAQLAARPARRCSRSCGTCWMITISTSGTPPPAPSRRCWRTLNSPTRSRSAAPGGGDRS
ncbi:hypothetical protein [Actinomadura logoneensis]|nr:hypothetical protein [Actinomadura logoneensis]